MPLAVAADLVAGRRGCAPTSSRMPLGDPAEDEAGGADAAAIEQVERPRRCRRRRATAARPSADGSASAGTPQTWNHSSTSTVNALITRPSATLRNCGAGPLRRDELGDGVDRAQHLAAGLLVADDHAERALQLEHQLEGVDRIEAEAGAEQRRGAVDLVGVDRQLEAADDRLLDLALQLVGHRLSLRRRRRLRQPAVHADHLAGDVARRRRRQERHQRRRLPPACRDGPAPPPSAASRAPRPASPRACRSRSAPATPRSPARACGASSRAATRVSPISPAFEAA